MIVLISLLPSPTMVSLSTYLATVAQLLAGLTIQDTHLELVKEEANVGSAPLHDKTTAVEFLMVALDLEEAQYVNVTFNNCFFFRCWLSLDIQALGKEPTAK